MPQIVVLKYIFCVEHNGFSKVSNIETKVLIYSGLFSECNEIQ